MPKDWKITSQKLETVLNPDDSGFSQQWNIGYLITDGPAKGTHGHVHAHPSELDRETVHAAIEELVHRHHRIAEP